jgi:hypothetical protein
MGRQSNRKTGRGRGRGRMRGIRPVCAFPVGIVCIDYRGFAPRPDRCAWARRSRRARRGKGLGLLPAAGVQAGAAARPGTALWGWDGNSAPFSEARGSGAGKAPRGVRCDCRERRRHPPRTGH